MKPNTKAFVDTLLSNPKMSQTEAYIRTHKTTSRKSASVSASQLLAKPSVAIYLAEHVDKARNKVVDLVDNATKDDVKLRAAQDILDRSYGKAVQKEENISKGISFTIDLSGDHYKD